MVSFPFHNIPSCIVQAVHIPPAEPPQLFAEGKGRPVFPDQFLGLAHHLPSNGTVAVGSHGRVQKRPVLPPLPEAAVDEQDQVNGPGISRNEPFLVFPVQEGDPVFLLVVGNVP